MQVADPISFGRERGFIVSFLGQYSHMRKGNSNLGEVEQRWLRWRILSTGRSGRRSGFVCFGFPPVCVCVCVVLGFGQHLYSGSVTQRDTDRERHRDADKDRDRETQGHTPITEIKTHRQTYRQTDEKKATETKTDRERERGTQTQGTRATERQRDGMWSLQTDCWHRQTDGHMGNSGRRTLKLSSSPDISSRAASMASWRACSGERSSVGIAVIQQCQCPGTHSPPPSPPLIKFGLHAHICPHKGTHAQVPQDQRPCVLLLHSKGVGVGRQADLLCGHE